MGNLLSFPSGGGISLPGLTTSSAGQYITTQIGTCPTITLTTRTAYVDTTLPISTTSTITNTYHQYPSTITITPTSTYTQRNYQSTTTSTYPTSTFYALTVVPASFTASQPTAQGFTPADCNQAYYDPTTTSTNTVQGVALTITSTTIPAITPATVYANPVYSTVTLPDAGVLTQTTYPQVTVTSTRSEATTTRYAACQTNNIVAAAPSPGGGYIYQVLAKYGYTDITPYPGVNAEDCCGRCQARDNCTGSVWYPDGRPEPCKHIIKETASTCDPKSVGELATGQVQDDPYLYISNSRCGQFIFDQF